MTGTRRRVEKLEREVGVKEPVRIYCAHLGEVAPPGSVKVTFHLDRPGTDTESGRGDEDSEEGRA